MTVVATPDLEPLAAEALTRFRSEPDVPALAVETVCRSLGAAPDDDLLRAAVRGTTEAARGWAPDLGVAYRPWALFHAVHRAFEHLRGARRGDRPALARIRAAMLGHLAGHREVLDPFHDTRDHNIARLHGFSDALMANAAGRMAFGGLTKDEDDVVLAEGARRTAEALAAAMADLDPADAELLRRCFVEGKSVRAVARETGQRYEPLLDRHHALLALLGARLRGRGVQPVWIEGVSGEVFAEGAANDAGQAK